MNNLQIIEYPSQVICATYKNHKYDKPSIKIGAYICDKSELIKLYYQILETNLLCPQRQIGSGFGGPRIKWWQYRGWDD